MALWFGITVIDDDCVTVSQEMYGPFEDMDMLSESLDERVAEIEVDGQFAVPLVLELCTDDIPEVVEYEI